MSEIPRTIRAATPADRSFIVETSTKVRWPQRSGVSWREWQAAYGPAARSAFEHGQTLVMEAAGVLLGFVVVVDDAVFMLYVKRELRGEGFGRELLTAAGAPVEAIAPTPCWKKWAQYHGIRWQEQRRQHAA